MVIGAVRYMGGLKSVRALVAEDDAIMFFGR